MKKRSLLLLLVLVFLIPGLLGLSVFSTVGFLRTTGGPMTGAILWPNNSVMLQAKDSGGTTRTVLLNDSSNEVLLNGIGNNVGFGDGAGSYSLLCTTGRACQFNGTVSSTLPCGTNHARTGPNNCTRTTTDASGVTVGTGCTTVNLLSNWDVPSAAKTVDLTATFTLVGGSAAGVESIGLAFFSDAGCTTALGGWGQSTTIIYQGYVQAVAAGQYSVHLHGNLYNNGATTIYAKKTETVAGTGSTTLVLRPDIGYTD
jgi:hypothetical protein